MGYTRPVWITCGLDSSIHFARTQPRRAAMWTSFGCSCGRTFVPIIYEEGSIHMDQHIFDQWSLSHLIWGYMLGVLSSAPKSVPAWVLGLGFVGWELWENVIEVAFSTYAPGQYYGDSVINSVFDMIPSMTGVWIGRHKARAWPLILLAEICATRMGFGIHSVFLGHQGSICDVRKEPYDCGLAYFKRMVVGPILFVFLERCLWKMSGKAGAKAD